MLHTWTGKKCLDPRWLKKVNEHMQMIICISVCLVNVFFRLYGQKYIFMNMIYDSLQLEKVVSAAIIRKISHLVFAWHVYLFQHRIWTSYQKLVSQKMDPGEGKLNNIQKSLLNKALVIRPRVFTRNLFPKSYMNYIIRFFFVE